MHRAIGWALALYAVSCAAARSSASFGVARWQPTPSTRSALETLAAPSPSAPSPSAPSPSASLPSEGSALASVPGGYAAIVVLGNRPARDAEGRASSEVRRRVRTGVSLFHRGAARRLLLSGGPALAGDESEAEVMAQLAVLWGVPQAALLLETRSRSTVENARYSHQLLCRGRHACAPKVLVVTNSLHSPRAVELFRCAGFVPRAALSPLPEVDRPRAQSWEWVANAASWFTDTCEAARPKSLLGAVQ